MFTLTGTSGTLSHSATVTVTISPPPDFTLTLSPTSLSITPGATGSQVSITANPINSFINTVEIAITGLPAGVTANPSTPPLAPGTAQNIIITATTAALAGTSTVTFIGTSGTLTHSVSLALTIQSAPQTSALDVTTFHYNVARDGLNPLETILTQSNVNSTQFGKIGFDTVDGKVDAQPLYLANVIVGGQSHNILYVATEHASVYAFDADTGTQLWKTSVLGSTETTSDDHNCSQITPEIGITSTPVIDRKQGPNGTLFTVAMSKDSTGAYHQRLHALDITTGAEITGSPTEITATYPGTGDNTQNGNVVFDPAQYAERAALLLLNGNIYMGWTSHCDIGLYTGWVMAYSESTLQQTQLLNLTPNGHEGSIWMSGGGIAADSQSYIYLLDANGTFDTALDANSFPTKGDYGNAMVKLSTTGKLAVADYFEMYNTESESSEDLDLGSGGPLLLPDQTDTNGSRSSPHRRRRQRQKHLPRRPRQPRQIQSRHRPHGQQHLPATHWRNGRPRLFHSRLLQRRALLRSRWRYPESLPTDKRTACPRPIQSDHDQIPTPRPYTIDLRQRYAERYRLGPRIQPLQPRRPPRLRSRQSRTRVLQQHSSHNGRDSFGNGNKFITPMIVNGKVYVGTQNGVAVFGLLPTTPATASATHPHSSLHSLPNQR